MLLDPSNYLYSYFKQNRKTGDEGGESGRIYLGEPIREGLCPVLVKSHIVSDAVNELVACTIGPLIGVNTPRAWLFDPELAVEFEEINFDHAIGIEYLDGLTDEDAVKPESMGEQKQLIRGEILHFLLGQGDDSSFARCNGKIYTFDFTTSLYPQSNDLRLPKYLQAKGDREGFYVYEELLLDKKLYAQKDIYRFFNDLRKEGIPDDIIIEVYSDMRDKMMKAYAETDRFGDMIRDIYYVFGAEVATFIHWLVGAMYNAIVDIPELQGDSIEYLKTEDGVIITLSNQ